MRKMNGVRSIGHRTTHWGDNHVVTPLSKEVSVFVRARVLWVLAILMAGVQTIYAVSAPHLEIASLDRSAMSFVWSGQTGETYRLQQSTNLGVHGRWSDVYSDIMCTGRITRTVATESDRCFYRVTASSTPTNWVEVNQLLDDFEWPSDADPLGQDERGYRYYGRLAADRGDMGGGRQVHSLTVTNGVLIAEATSGARGTSWVGRWHSTSHTGMERDEVLDFSAPLSPIINAEWQPMVSALYVRVRGSGTIKMELKDSAGNLLTYWTRSGTWGAGFEDVVFEVGDPGAYPSVKLINLVVQSPSDLEFDEIGLRVSVPGWIHADLLRYGFVTCYAALLRGYDQESGYTRDHVHWPAGRFDSLPGCGFQALGAALAYDLGLLSFDAATQLVSRSVATIVATPKHQGLLPHWMEQGIPKDWSTVDSSLTLKSSLLACAILGMTNVEATVVQMIDAIKWAPLTNALGQVAHGYREDLTLSPYFWGSWDGEGAIVQDLRLLKNPNAPLFNMDASQPIYGGRGFIAEIAGLFAPEFALVDQDDLYGVNWRSLREDMLAMQKAYFPSNYPGSLAATAGLNGLSSIEVIDASGNTSYFSGGVGTPTVPADDGGGWIAPHYAAMASTLDLGGAIGFLSALRDAGVFQPLIGLPEGVKAANAGSEPELWHSAQITLNSFFNVVGLYHAIRLRDGAPDVIYRTSKTHPRFRAAIDVLFP